MKIILAVLGLVVFAGCQDLGDYPDYAAPKTTTPGTTGDGTGTGTTNGGRPADVIPVGCPRIIRNQDFACVQYNTFNFKVYVSSPITKATRSSSAPEGVFFNDRMRSDDAVFYYFEGNARVSGVYHISLDLQNESGTSRCWVTLNVVAGRQSVSQ